MLSQQEIFDAYNSAKPIQKYILLSHLLLESFLFEKSREDCSEEEYNEALITASHFVYFKIANEREFEERKLREMFIWELWEYFEPVDDNLDDEVDKGLYKFLLDRYETIEIELFRLTDSPTYFMPMLIFNLWVKPMNRESLDVNEVMERIDSDELFKKSIYMKTVLKNFHKLLDETFTKFQSGAN